MELEILSSLFDVSTSERVLSLPDAILMILRCQLRTIPFLKLDKFFLSIQIIQKLVFDLKLFQYFLTVVKRKIYKNNKLN